MCLSNVTKKYPEDDMTEGEGWKLFSIIHEHNYCPCYPTFIPPNQWIKSNRAEILSDSHEHYLSGFHIFTTEEQAKKHWLYKQGHCPKKIKYKGIICEGNEDCNGVWPSELTQAFSDCLVVKEIYLPLDDTIQHDM
jgi:hypothetical protein